VILTVFWSPLGFPVLDILPEKQPFTSEYFCTTIGTQLAQCALAETRQSGGRQLPVHMDNATPHRSKQTKEFMAKNRLISAAHPPKKKTTRQRLRRWRKAGC
jgi:hypothetical protein